jgi:hypothetical protein
MVLTGSGSHYINVDDRNWCQVRDEGNDRDAMG